MTTLTNCIVIGNTGTQNGGGISCKEATLAAINCTFSGNYAPKGNSFACIFANDAPSYINMYNCIIRDGGNEIWNSNESLITITYSNICGGWAGEGNIDADPCFADREKSDYHLKSQAGRWDAKEGRWVMDDATSPCIDAGDPMTPISHEPFPNGGIVNMGAYGGTAEASKSYFGEPLCETIITGDINGDCIVDFKDFALMSLHWLADNSG